MPLHLIHGPPNTGRTDLVEDAFREMVREGEEPFLVVPGIDDIFGWERRLTRDGQAIAGGRVMHFRDLCREILVQAGEPRADGASEMQRLHFVRKALHREWPKLATRLENQPGLPASVLDLIDEFRSEMIDPGTLAARIDESELKGLKPLVGVYSAYIDLLVDGAGLSDGPRETERAIGVVSGCWGERPLFIAGFDDVTPQQRELIRRVSVDASAPVTVAVSHELDNPALDWTNELVSSLRDDARATTLTEEQTTREKLSEEHDPVLLELERRFMRTPDDEGLIVRTGNDPADRSTEGPAPVTVLTSSGARNEAEAIGSEIARLVRDEVDPGDIAIAVGSPAANGPLIRDTLVRYSIPVALEAETSAHDTTAGQTILSVLAAVMPGAGTSGLLSWLRSPLGPDPETVDQAEFRAVVEGVSSARGLVEILDSGPPEGWEQLIEAVDHGGSVNEAIAEISIRSGARLLAMDTGLPPSPGTAIETQMASAIASAARELAKIQEGRSNGIEEIRSAIETGAITIWSVPAANTVRIASPYSLRAKRFKHLFMASQQEGGIRDMDRSGPFLSKSDRDGLGMSDRRDPEVQERYLFYSCLTVPTDGLWISCQTSDEAGKAEQPSPFIAMVEQLFDVESEKDRAIAFKGRAGSDIAFAFGDSPSLVEAARSIAASGGDADLLEGFTDRVGTVRAGLEAARLIEAETRTLGNLKLEPVLDELRKEPTFAATDVEAFAGCPYRWFVQRQLRPTDFGPEPDYMAMGSLVHSTLEDLFNEYLLREEPDRVKLNDLYGGGAPDGWLDLASELVEKHAAKPGSGLDGSDPGSRGNCLRARALVHSYLKQESKRFRDGPPPSHRVALVELAFGTRRAELDAVPMDGWSLIGKIDRVDLGPGDPDGSAEAVAMDYKTGDVSKLSQAAVEKSGKIQLQLYLHALRSLHYRPVASLYVPLRQVAETSRGAYSAEARGEMVRRGASTSDGVEDLDDFIDRGVALANKAAQGILSGEIEHGPAGCPDHFSHASVPDSGETDS